MEGQDLFDRIMQLYGESLRDLGKVQAESWKYQSMLTVLIRTIKDSQDIQEAIMMANTMDGLMQRHQSSKSKED